MVGEQQVTVLSRVRPQLCDVWRLWRPDGDQHTLAVQQAELTAPNLWHLISCASVWFVNE